MSPNEIRDVLTAVPFTPFRMILSDGTRSYDIADPLHALVGNRFVHVGIPATPGDLIADAVVRLDPLHITQLVPLSGPPRAPQGNGQAGG